MRSQSWFMGALGAFLLAVPGLAGAQQMPRLPQDNSVGVVDDTRGGLPQVKEENGISYISGGAGKEEAEALDHMGGRFNLKLTTAISSGQYTSPSMIRIDSARGSRVLEIRPNGPIFLAKLPSGDYVVQATAEGQTMTRKVTVPASGLESVAMTWPAAGVPERAGDAPK